MKLIYISPLRYPSEKAGSLFSIKSCEIFGSQEIETEIWIPIRRNNIFCKDTFDYYGVKRNFKIRRFFSIDLIRFGTWAYFLLYFSFATSIFFYVLWKKIFGGISKYVFYSHEQFALFFLTFLSKKTFYEMHDFPGSQKIYQKLFSRIKGVITTNKWKVENLSKRFNIPAEEILVVPNAVSPEDFSVGESQTELQKKFGLENEKYLFGYIGGFLTMGMEKGVGTAIDSLQFLSEDYKLYVVGGESPQNIEIYKKYAKDKNLSGRVIFVGPVPHSEVPLRIAVCDCLVAPFPKNDHYSYYMSPMKLFEYMASKKPLIVTDLPSLREIVSDEINGLIVPPSDPEALARAIKRLSDDKLLARKLAENAYLEVLEKYTWQKRSQKIITFLENI
jgi:glycosyltransferase involved in cell wall biosynthesis